jgi:hypothetical protein
MYPSIRRSVPQKYCNYQLWPLSNLTKKLRVSVSMSVSVHPVKSNIQKCAVTSTLKLVSEWISTYHKWQLTPSQISPTNQLPLGKLWPINDLYTKRPHSIMLPCINMPLQCVSIITGMDPRSKNKWLHSTIYMIQSTLL